MQPCRAQRVAWPVPGAGVMRVLPRPSTQRRLRCDLDLRVLLMGTREEEPQGQEG